MAAQSINPDKGIFAALELPYPDAELENIVQTMQEDAGLLARLGKDFSYLGESSPPVPPAETVERALSLLQKAGLLHGPEMRHEASLAPLGLLRQWRIDTNVAHGRHKFHLGGLATAYGRGPNLASARVSCLMEIVERASAYASVQKGGSFSQGFVPGRHIDLSLEAHSCAELQSEGRDFLVPFCGPLEQGLLHHNIHWLEGRYADGSAVLLPAQAIFLFLNLDEVSLFDAVGSTGLATGNTVAQAKLSALLEVLERDAESTHPICLRECFIPKSRDSKIQALLDDYRACGIFVYLQDIGTEAGLPVFRSIVYDGQNPPVCASAAHLSGSRAALAALTETPWPYSLNADFTGRRSMRLGQVSMTRYLEDLPDYSRESPEASLALLEKMLACQRRKPAYIEIGRRDLGFPVIRAFIPQLETCRDFDFRNSPGPRFFARHSKGNFR